MSTRESNEATTPEGSLQRSSSSPYAAEGDIITQLEAVPSFSTFAKAVRMAGLTPLLREKGPFALFVPTNRAFARVPAAELDALLADGPRLVRVLRRHIVPRRVRGPRADAPTSARSIGGATLTVRLDEGVYRVNGARVVKPRTRATNGVLRGIDRVLKSA